MIFLLIFFCVPVFAQYKFSGTVVDKKSREPLPGVNVYFPELQRGDVTDQNGKFLVPDLPKAKLNVQFSFVGYASRILNFYFDEDKTTFNILMEPDILLSEEVVISGGYYSTQDENAVKIDVVNRSSLQKMGTPNYLEAISVLPGVDLISRGSGIGKPVIRGLSMNDVLVLNDGVRVENYQFGVNHPLGLNEFGVEKVEVIKGPASLLYGSDAIGGVINFIPEKPAIQGSMAGDYNASFNSNTLGLSSDLGVRATKGNYYGILRLGVKDNADYMQGNGDYAPNTRFKEKALKLSAGHLGSKGSIKLYYDYAHSKPGMLVPDVIQEGLIEERGRNLSAWYQDLENHLLHAKSKFMLGRFKLDASAAYQSNYRSLIEEEDEPAVEMRLNTLTYDVKLYLPSDEKSDLLFGFQGMNQDNENINQRETVFLPNANMANYSVYVFARRMHWGKFHPQAGIRYDYRIIDSPEMEARGGHSHGEDEEEHEDEHRILPEVDKTFGNLSASVGLTYYLTPAWLVRINYALGFRAPNLSELTSNGLHAGRFERGNPDLGPQRSGELDFSMHVHTDHLSFDLALFYNNIKDYIYLSPTNDTAPVGGSSVYLYEQTNARLYGLEAGIHYHPVGMDWLHLKSSFSNVTGERSDGAYLPLIPASKLINEVRFSFEKAGPFRNFFINVQIHSVLKQDRPATFESKTPAYNLLNAGIGAQLDWTRQKLEMGINVNNLLDETYVDHLSSLKPMGIYNPGRNINIYLHIPFKLE